MDIRLGGVSHLAAFTGADSIVVSWGLVLAHKAGLVDPRGRRGRRRARHYLLWACTLRLYSCGRDKGGEMLSTYYLTHTHTHFLTTHSATETTRTISFIGHYRIPDKKDLVLLRESLSELLARNRPTRWIKARLEPKRKAGHPCLPVTLGGSTYQSRQCKQRRSHKDVLNGCIEELAHPSGKELDR